MSRFSVRIRNYRTNHNLLQRDVCELTGIARSKLSAYENGHIVPSGTSLEKLMDLYELDEKQQEDLLREWEVQLLVKPKAIYHMGKYKKSINDILQLIEGNEELEQ